MRVNLPRVRPNTPPSAKAEDRFRRALEWLSRARAGPGLVMTRAGLARDVPPAMDVRLVGVSSPYSGVEQVGTAGGGWADRAGGATVACFELNAQSGLGGAVVRVRLIGPDWRFAFHRIGTATMPSCAPCDPAALPPTLYLSWTFVSGPYGATTTISPIELDLYGVAWSSTRVYPNPADTVNGYHEFHFQCLSGHLYLIHNFSRLGMGFTDSYAICYPVDASAFACDPFSADWSRTYTGEYESDLDPSASAISICGGTGEFEGGVVNRDTHLVLTA